MTARATYSILIDIVGLELRHLHSGLLPNISKLAESGESASLETVFPTLTCPVQASILSGRHPNEHGIIANGMYDRETFSVSFWEQPSSLVKSERAWDIARRNGSKAAVLFWQNTMYANADIVVTPRPIHLDDKMIMWCYSKPIGYYEELSGRFGEFDLTSYWGPLASPMSSEWIGKAAEYTFEKHRPNQLFVYIPHVDYSAQRFGKNAGRTHDDIRKADEIVGKLVEKVSKLQLVDQTNFTIVSEYGFNDVDGAIPINLCLRDAGLLTVRSIHGKEYLDFEHSKAFAMVDHQVAHIYVHSDYEDKTRKLVEATKGIDKVLDKSGKVAHRIDHQRSGELVAIANRDKWFSYYWWHDSEVAPEFAHKVDIHRKPGYDPVELFFDPKTRSIPLVPALVKGSHGRPPDQSTGEGLAFYASNRKHGIARSGVAQCTDIMQVMVKC
jgi:predicted AlkP superfamily pyrophosphatase or phosphodiesterase